MFITDFQLQMIQIALIPFKKKTKYNFKARKDMDMNHKRYLKNKKVQLQSHPDTFNSNNFRNKNNKKFYLLWN